MSPLFLDSRFLASPGGRGSPQILIFHWDNRGAIAKGSRQLIRSRQRGRPNDYRYSFVASFRPTSLINANMTFV